LSGSRKIEKYGYCRKRKHSDHEGLRRSAKYEQKPALVNSPPRHHTLEPVRMADTLLWRQGATLCLNVRMRTLIVPITAAILSATAPATAAEFPVYSPEGWCMDAARAKGGTPDEGVFRSCLYQEQQGYDSI
jgi:hypothetical protein